MTGNDARTHLQALAALGQQEECSESAFFAKGEDRPVEGMWL
jgi:hypothetical protein